MKFEFATATRIIFGPGTVQELPALAREMAGGASVPASRIFLVRGSTDRLSGPLAKELARQGFAMMEFPVTGEPTTDLVQDGVRQAREFGTDLVIGLGGGSVIDAGKAIAGLVTNSGGLMEYLEVIGQGKGLPKPGLPYIAVPTTAGPGTEVTRNAVLASPQHRVKVSLRSPLLLPKLVLVDPEFTYDLPPSITASTGLDALTQLIEPFLSARANPLTDVICRDGMRLASEALLTAFRNGSDHAAREKMSLASLYGGLALANAGLGAVHGFAGPIGGMFPAPHGAVCAALLPYVLEVNLRAVEHRAAGSETLRPFKEMARILTRNANAEAADSIGWVKSLYAELKIPPLRTYGITREHLPILCEKSAVASSMKGNPIKLGPEEMREILERAL